MSPDHRSSEPGPAGQEIAAIWAQTRDGVIGHNGTMPWHVPEDFAHFKAQTTGHPVIMGRRTWESFPDAFRPLPGRTNIVITADPERIEGAGALSGATGTEVVVVSSYGQAVAAAAQAPGAELTWVIGGGRLYRDALTDAHRPVTRAVVSVLDLELDGDTHAPELGASWYLAEDGEQQVSRTGVPWRIQTWRRSDPRNP